jgi:hypothetical protein
MAFRGEPSRVPARTRQTRKVRRSSPGTYAPLWDVSVACSLLKSKIQLKVVVSLFALCG